ncbi:hypothetical protein cypCar_00007227 [Cyprinus carpio]|nr:hypothetical protein cypCar_00007227 [Cyprinus carpio]
MPVCDICCEELPSEAEMRTHLLLSHMENVMACPFCSLSGVSYDELSFHISIAHIDKDCQDTKTTVADSGQENLNDWTAQRPSSTKTSNVNVKNMDKVSQASPQSPPQVNGMTSPITGTCLSQGISTSPKSSPPAVARASGAIKLVRTTPTSSNNATRERKDGRRKSKQKRLSSPLKEGCFSCPMCSLVCKDCFILQEHVELHLQDQDAAEGVLPQNINITFARAGPEAGTSTEASSTSNGRSAVMDYECPMCSLSCPSSSSLQEHVELHLEYGSASATGLVEALCRYYQKDASDCAHVWLCAETDHYSSSEGDKGWGCGYRNFQMLLSSLHRMEQYNLLPVSVPSIPRVQALIEEAWGQGADPQGASHFNHRLQGTRAWIGATEIYAVFTSLSVKARIVDFHKPTGPGDTHPRLFEWVKQYFSHSASRVARLPPKVVQTTLPPIYLQHQGHSRSIVGVEQKVNGNLCLLLFDPGCAPREMRRVLSQDTAATMVRRMRKFSGGLKHRQYQAVAVEGLLTPEEKRSRILNSRTLCAEKIP